MVLTKQTYNNQDRHKKPKDILKKFWKLNLTKPKLTLAYLPLTTSGQEIDRAYSYQKPQLPEPEGQITKAEQKYYLNYFDW